MCQFTNPQAVACLQIDLLSNSTMPPTSICMPIYLSVLCVYLPTCMPIYLSVCCVSTYLYAYLWLPVYLSIYLSLCLPTYLCVYLFVWISIYVSVYLPTCLYVCLSIYLSVRLPTYLSAHSQISLVYNTDTACLLMKAVYKQHHFMIMLL